MAAEVRTFPNGVMPGSSEDQGDGPGASEPVVDTGLEVASDTLAKQRNNTAAQGASQVRRLPAYNCTQYSTLQSIKAGLLPP